MTGTDGGRSAFAVPARPGDRPARTSRRRRVALFAAAAVVALGAGLLVRQGTQGSAAHGYRLTLPRTLDAGTYTLSQDTSGAAVAGLHPDGSGPGMRDMTGVSAAYKGSAGPTAHRLLDFDGAYGTVDDPDLAVRGILGFMADSGEGDVAVQPARITPAGAKEPLTCEVLKSSGDNGTPGFLPMCAWADSDTVGAVAVTDYLALAPSAGSVDLAAFARQVDTIRGEVRVRRG